MVASATLRASGLTGAQETAAKAVKEGDQPLDTEIDNKRKFRSPGFARMRLDWGGDEAIILSRAKAMVENRLIHDFADAYQVLNRIYDRVREPVLDEHGEPKRDPQTSFVVWKQDEYGNFHEDWDKLTRGEREDLLFTITTRLFQWEQNSQDAWGEAMFSKGVWEERYSIDFDAPMAGTMGDREAAGRIGAAEERYFAIFKTLYSKKTEALVRSLNLISQRLRDSLYSGR